MPTSNIIYPVCTGRIKRIVFESIIKALDRKIPNNVITMWPALMFAASRKDKVKGRTRILIVSTRTKKGFSQSGAPGGRRLAVNFLKE